jgi:single-strand DNA-binding protein
MALQLNTVQIAGNLGADPKVRTTESGNLVCNLRVASNEYAGKDSAGQARYHTEWHTVVLWNQLAEFAANLEKGDGVFIEGALRTRSYDDREGNKRTVTEIRASRLQRTTGSPSGADAHEPIAPDAVEDEPAA